MTSLVRDAGLVASGGDARLLANLDRRPVLDSLARTLGARSDRPHIRAPITRAEGPRTQREPEGHRRLAGDQCPLSDAARGWGRELCPRSSRSSSRRSGGAQTFLLNDLLFADVPLPGQPVWSGLVAGDKVVVQSEAGSAVGAVVPTPSTVMERRQLPEHSPNRVYGKPRLEDVMVRLKRQQREQEAHRVALLKIRERGLEMKLTRVEQLFDGSRLIFYFTAEGRVDFRELVRELASEFHTRIEMRQIGARDEAKMLGGYGSCGRPLCCTTWLNASSRCRSRWRSSRISA